MMVKPLLKDLEKHVDSKYTLVTLAAKRARELTDGDPALVNDVDSDKPVSVALHEIAENKIGFARIKDGIK
ncbi:DNA-directed RNA polymerase subunit omega [Veillonella magna]|jgi:DNA-directed RNA polymerase subunit omega|uniref:DNA-directed RNA polymerase subunit omega n=1 Tax=Veillonella magna TaxID=464322 RepID=A0ABS2GGC9_9FIRM|nr:DNA-directed RNA polymerase subunit omega [Veillonella magna]MBD8975748.1 DNA-directed RNA polymerase subunit omega [Veillonella magna]MBM6824175.1 DNA-directed RNA polymerase subunit omega [Veillonella magna]MBM6912468.1 DNA-directed RNA polymerase subunit omega [Veillonella magna]